MSIFDMFKKKEVAKSPKQQVSDIRDKTQQIANLLAQIRFSASAGTRIPAEKMDWYRQTIGGLAAQIGRAKVLRLDTTDIDQEIMGLAEELEAALNAGNVNTADRIIKGLTYGIIYARKDLSDKEATRAEETIERRKHRLTVYRNIVALSHKTDEIEKSIQQQSVKLDKYREGYEQCRKEMKELFARRPDLAKELDELGFGNDRLSPGARKLDGARMQVIALNDNIEALERQKATQEATLTEINAMIRTLETQLTQADALVDGQTLAEIREQQEMFLREMLQVEKQIDEMEQINKNFVHSMDSIYSAPEMVNRAIRHALDFEELERREEEKAAGIREGQKMLEKLQQEETQENETLLNV